jgi:hypothetical protein
MATALALAAIGPSAAVAASPVVQHTVVFRDGTVKAKSVRAAETTVRVGSRRCRVRTGTALAALARSGAGRLSVRDFGRCSSRVRDGGGLFVRAIGPDANRGTDGWVYKVGTKLATAGSADPSGAFGRGLLRTRARVTWFYCRADPETRGCQRTLNTATSVGTDRIATVRVRAYDDAGRSIPAAGATVTVGATTAVADADGVARLALGPGTYRVLARRASEAASGAERIVVG